MHLVALDIETADYANSAPCSIGLAVIDGLNVVETKSYLINPEVDFSPFAMRLHGITPENVKNSPTLPEIWGELLNYLVRYPVVAHNASFDMSVLAKATARYSLDLPNIDYYCTLETGRSSLSLSKYDLSSICMELGIACESHHDAVNDAVACAELVIYFLSNNIPLFRGGRVIRNDDDLTEYLKLDEFSKKSLQNIKSVILESGVDYGLVRFKNNKTLDINCYFRAIKIGLVRGKHFIAVREKYLDLVDCDLPHDSVKAFYRFYFEKPSELILFSKYIVAIIEKSAKDWAEYKTTVTERTIKNHFKQHIKSTNAFMNTPNE